MSRADGRDRTGDPRFTKPVLCQLSYVGGAFRIVPPLGPGGLMARTACLFSGRCSRCRARAVQDVKRWHAGRARREPSKHRTAGWRPLCEVLPTDRVSPIEQRQAGASSPIPRAPELCRGLGRASETPRPVGRRVAARQASQPSRIAPGTATGLSGIRRLRATRGALPGSAGLCSQTS